MVPDVSVAGAGETPPNYRSGFGFIHGFVDDVPVPTAAPHAALLRSQHAYAGFAVGCPVTWHCQMPYRPPAPALEVRKPVFTAGTGASASSSSSALASFTSLVPKPSVNQL
jgi:hypothetical protein